MGAILSFMLCLVGVINPVPSPAPEDTAALLYQDIVTLLREGKAGEERGDAKLAREKYRLASYLLEKIRQDFPDWSAETVARELSQLRSALGQIPPPASSTPRPPGSPVSCYWQSVSPGPEFESRGGDQYEIALAGENPRVLTLSFRRLHSDEKEASICVELKNTPQPTVLMDTQNRGLFRPEAGEFKLALFVPPGSRLYLAEYTEDRFQPPRILSNILTLP